MAKSTYVIGFDIGTKKVAAIIGEITEERKIEVIGIGTAESQGLRKGVVVDLDATTSAIKKAQEEAELMAGVEIDSAFFGISGAHIKSFNSRGVDRRLGQEPGDHAARTSSRVIDQSKAIPIPPDREIIHVIPQEFVVDDQDGIKDPAGHERHQARGQRPHRHRRPDLHPEPQDLHRAGRHRHRGDRPQPDRHLRRRPDRTTSGSSASA